MTQLFLVILLVYTQITTFDNLWPAKPRWREAVIQASATRSTLEPALMLITPQSPVAYYDRFYHLLNGITIDIGWQRFPPEEIANITNYLTANESIWAILTLQDPQSWDALAALSPHYGISYRDSVQGTIFYRFDENASEAFNFQFKVDDTFSIPVAWDYQTYAIGEPICPENIVSRNTPYTVEVSLIRDYNDIISATTSACLTIPDTHGILHVRLSLIDSTGKRLPLIENGQYWGDYLLIGALHNP